MDYTPHSDRPDVGKMTPKERLRFWAKHGAAEAKARGDFAKHRADLEGMALTIGAELIEVIGDTYKWLGPPTEVVMAGRLVLDDNLEDGDIDQHDDDLWPVNVEKELLAELRASAFDLDEALLEHATAREERGGGLTATAAMLRTGPFIILTAADPLLGIEATYAFAVERLG